MISNEPSSGVDKNICRKILEYLMAKKDYRDDLDGILLGVYEQEIERLSKTTLQNLGYLISIGIIEEEKNGDGSGWYKITADSEKVSEILKRLEL
jgi:predicted transcriptional regulator with HTH domain